MKERLFIGDTFEVGDKVRITRKLTDYEVSKWDNYWLEEMDDLIGEIGMVVYANRDHDNITIRFDHTATFALPKYVLVRA